MFRRCWLARLRPPRIRRQVPIQSNSAISPLTSIGWVCPAAHAGRTSIDRVGWEQFSDNRRAGTLFLTYVRKAVAGRIPESVAQFLLDTVNTTLTFPLGNRDAIMNLKVLVADDSSTMRKIIIRSLEAVGVTGAVEACDGAEAFNKYQGDNFDLILTDWNMPNKTGLELVKDVRTSGGTLPIIMITTEAEKPRVVEAVTAGVSDYLIKPFTAEALRAKLEKFV